MVTLEQHIKACQEIVKAYPQAKTLPVIYSSDDEGNAFHHVQKNPTFMKIENLGEHHLDDVEINDIKDGNAICIN